MAKRVTSPLLALSHAAAPLRYDYIIYAFTVVIGANLQSASNLCIFCLVLSAFVATLESDDSRQHTAI